MAMLPRLREQQKLAKKERRRARRERKRQKLQEIFQPTDTPKVEATP